MKKKRITFCFILLLLLSALLMSACSMIGIGNGECDSHDYGDWQTIIEPTCTKKGISRRTCKKCDHFIEREIPMLDHTWGDYTVVKPATCTETGKEKRICIVCGAEEYSSLGLAKHTFETENGIDKYYWSEHVCGAERKAWRYCRVCKQNIYENGTSMGYYGHEYENDFTIDKEKTCIEDGSKSRHCKYCDSKIDVTVIKKCHEYGEYTVVQGMTCTQNRIEQKTCSVCGDIYEKITETTGHSYKNYPEGGTKYATCSSEGYRHEKCWKCNDVQKIVIPVNENAHQYGEFIIDSSGNCNYLNPVKGERHKICKLCNDRVDETFDAPHSYDENSLICTHCHYQGIHTNLFTFIKKGEDWYIKEINLPDNTIKTIRVPTTTDKGEKIKGIQSISSSYIENLFLPEGIEVICDNAFSGCGNLKSLFIPSSVKIMGKNILHGCYTLESIVLPFINGLKEDGVSIDVNRPIRRSLGYYFNSFNNKEYTYSVRQIVSYELGVKEELYYIPKSLKNVYVSGGDILEGAFWDCKNHVENIYLGTAFSAINNTYLNRLLDIDNYKLTQEEIKQMLKENKEKGCWEMIWPGEESTGKVEISVYNCNYLFSEKLFYEIVE